MAIFNIKENKVKATVFAVTGFYLVLVALFYAYVPMPYKFRLPVGLLFVTSLWLTPWEISLALLFSAMGDYAGTTGHFIAQMATFAVAHIFYITFFVRRYICKGTKMTSKMKGYLMMLGICVAALIALIFVKVVPAAPAGVLRIGVSIYALMISAMLYTALMQRSLFYALGALLFVISDFILAWNKFLEPVPYRDILVLGTYFAAQWLLFIRATPYRVKHPVHLMRF